MMAVFGHCFLIHTRSAGAENVIDLPFQAGTMFARVQLELLTYFVRSSFMKGCYVHYRNYCHLIIRESHYIHFVRRLNYHPGPG